MSERSDELQKVLGNLNELLGGTDLKDVSADGAGFKELPDGYYLSEVESAKLTVSKSTHQPMVAFQFKVAADGFEANDDGDLISLAKTANRKLFIYYILKDDASVKRFVSDMLKFEGTEPGKPLLEREYFMNADVLEDALDILVGRRIYVQISTTEKSDGTTSTWQNLISWKRAEALTLPV